MAEYIERKVAKDELLSWAVCIKHPEHLMKEDAMCVLDNIPAADVAPVVRGRWKCVGQVCVDGEWYDILRCGNCDIPVDRKSRYCPHCGAKMEDGAE